MVAGPWPKADKIFYPRDGRRGQKSRGEGRRAEGKNARLLLISIFYGPR